MQWANKVNKAVESIYLKYDLCTCSLFYIGCLLVTTWEIYKELL